MPSSVDSMAVASLPQTHSLTNGQMNGVSLKDRKNLLVQKSSILVAFASTLARLRSDTAIRKVDRIAEAG
jgi:hypothetical protein